MNIGSFQQYVIELEGSQDNLQLQFLRIFYQGILKT